MYIRFLFIFLLVPTMSFSQDIRILNFTELQTELRASNDSIIILNFWATWCKPCIEELPHFEKINSEYHSEGVKVILVNLDFNSKVESVTLPFVKKKELKSEIYHLSDIDPNEWIDKIDSRWSGAIPATAIYQGGEKLFFLEGQMNEEELILNLEKILKKKTNTKELK